MSEHSSMATAPWPPSKPLEEGLPLIAPCKDQLQDVRGLLVQGLRLHCGGLGIPTPRRGIMLVAASAVIFSFLSTFIKYASRSMPSMETVFWRSLVAWIVNRVAMRICGIKLTVKRELVPLLTARCLIGCCCMSLEFYALQQMVLADASVLIFTSPIITFFLGAVLLRERIDAIGLCCTLLSFVGVVCVARPAILFGVSIDSAAKMASPFAIACALLSAATQACVYICIRRLQDVHFMVMTNYFMLTGTVVSFAWLMLSFVLHLDLLTWLAIISAGVLGVVAQLCMTRGFQLEPAGTASIMRYLDIACVFVWDVVLLHERVSPWSVLGALCIFSCAVLILVRRG